MEYMNIVRMTFKPGKLDEFRAYVNENASGMAQMPGLIGIKHVQTGERSLCVVGRWESREALANARPMLVGNLDNFRHMLEKINDDLGETDPVSGAVIFSTD